MKYFTLLWFQDWRGDSAYPHWAVRYASLRSELPEEADWNDLLWSMGSTPDG